MMPTEISLADFIEWTEEGDLEPCMTVNVSGEQRVYGKTPRGQGDTPKGWILVYAIVP